MENKILRILKDSIKKFDNLKDMKVIAIFGSIVKPQNLNFDDLDIITISKKEVHDEFILFLSKCFMKENIQPIIFETILKKPKDKEEKQLLIHDLNYLSYEDLIRKEWKSVINTMKNETVVLYGDKNFCKKLPFQKITKSELLNPLVGWSQKISTKEEFFDFEKYLAKIIPRLLKEYEYLDLDNLKNIQIILSKNLLWKEKLKIIEESII